MAAVLIAMVASGVALGLVVRQGRVWPSPVPLVLRVLPAGLLLLSLPAAAAALGIIRGFQQIAAEGTGGERAAVALSVAAGQSLWLGSLMLVGLMIVVGLLQRRADLRARASVATEAVRSTKPPATEVSRWVALLSPLAMLPAGFAAFQIHEITTLIMAAADALAGDSPAATVAGMSLGEISRWLSARLILTVGLGGLLSLGLALLAGFNMFPLRTGPGSVLLARYGWATVALVAAVAGSLVLRLTLDLRWFESLGLTAAVP